MKDFMLYNNFNLNFKNISENIKDHIYIEDDNVFIEIELPGVFSNDIDLFLDGKKLTLKAKRKEYLYKETSDYKTIEKCYFIETNFDENNISTKFENGILIIKIPKTNNKKKIEIK